MAQLFRLIFVCLILFSKIILGCLFYCKSITQFYDMRLETEVIGQNGVGGNKLKRVHMATLVRYVIFVS